MLMQCVVTVDVDGVCVYGVEVICGSVGEYI